MAPVIPDHKLLRPIASGAYGEVWLARNVVETLRAVKIVRRDEHASAESFEREFKGLQKFEPVSRAHEGLVDILTLGLLPDGAGFYYVMELADPVEVQGPESEAQSPLGRPLASLDAGLETLDMRRYAPRTLRAELKCRSALPADEVITLGLKLTAALAHLHMNGLVHRDVKPSNILFIGSEPKLADAGLVAAVDDARSLVGTAGYIAPEGPGTPQADLYALGKVLYEAAFGKDRQEFPALPADVASRPDHARLLELNAILLKACATDRRERYQSADQMRADLELLHAGRSVKRRHVWQQSRKLVKKFCLGITITAIVVATGYFFVVSESRPPAIKLSKISAANEEYQSGLVSLHTSSSEAPAQAARHLERAVEIDARFGAAYARLSSAYVLMGPTNPQLLAKARDAALRAVSLDSRMSEAHAMLATVKLLLELDWSGAEKERRYACELSPNSEDTMVESALNLATMGRTNEAVAMIEQALRIDSRSVTRLRHAGNVFLWSRQYGRAIQKFEQVIEMSPSIQGRIERVNLAPACRANGEYLKSIQYERQSALDQGENPEAVNGRYDTLEKAFREKGAVGYWRNKLETELANTEAQSLISLAVIYAELYDSDTAFAYLNRALRETPSQFAFSINTNPSFDRLHSDARFVELTNALWHLK